MSALYSPPRSPWYNGSIESSNNWMKERTRFKAWRNGYEGDWKTSDQEKARAQANDLPRLSGHDGPTHREE